MSTITPRPANLDDIKLWGGQAASKKIALLSDLGQFSGQNGAMPNLNWKTFLNYQKRVPKNGSGFKNLSKPEHFLGRANLDQLYANLTYHKSNKERKTLPHFSLLQSGLHGIMPPQMRSLRDWYRRPQM